MPHTQDITALAAVLGIAVLCGLIMNRLRLPAVAGFILAGVVLGPTGAGLIAPSPAIETLAELGVLMLLFILGMEMRLTSFRAQLPLALGIAGALIGVTMGLAVLAAQWSAGATKSAIVIGFMLAISSTAVSMKMIEDADGRDSRPGQLAVAVLIAQDLAVVPLLLITNAMGAHGEHTAFFVGFRVLLALVLLGGFIAVLARLKSFRFPFSEFFLRDSDIATLCVLGLCFLAAAVSGLLGLSPALGAFLCGLAVGHSTLRPAAVRAAPPVQSILLFTFFLSVGLLIDLSYVWAHLWLVLAVLLAVAAGKTAINLGVLRLFRVEGDVAFRSALFLTPIGEFSFILAAAGASAGALTPEGYKLALSVIALSLLASPVWFVGARRAQGLARSGIDGAGALFRATYKSEIAVIEDWWRRARATAERARDARKARADAKKRAAGAYDFPWRDAPKELPKPEEPSSAPARPASPPPPDPDG